MNDQDVEGCTDNRDRLGLLTRPPVSDEMQQRAVEICFQSLEKYPVEKDAAMVVKKEFDRLYGTTWHCVVGTQ